MGVTHELRLVLDFYKKILKSICITLLRATQVPSYKLSLVNQLLPEGKTSWNYLAFTQGDPRKRGRGWGQAHGFKAF